MNTPKNIFLILLGLLAVSILGGGGLFYTYSGQLEKINQNTGKLLATQQITKDQIEIYKQAQKKIDELSFVEDLANSVLPPSKEQANLLAQIKKFIVDAGLGFESVTFNSADGTNNVNLSQTIIEKGLTGVRVLPLTAVIKEGGSYPQVISLLQTIESSQRKMQVTDLSLTPNENGSAFSTISVKINVFLKDNVPPPVDETATEI